MKPILFYDTETTGLPNWSAPSDDPSQPHITQLAAELVDEDTGDVLDSMDMLIQPDGWTIPDDVAALTGITTERADEWKAGAAFCTCANSTKLVNLPPTEKMLAAKRTGPKPPNLGEAFEFFTGRQLDGAHNAMVDVAGCREVYFGILRHREAA